MSCNNVYLGKVVKDVRKKGLDTLTEVEGICKAIILDYKKKKIPYRKAMSRLNLLSLVVTKSKNFNKQKKIKAKKIIEKYRALLSEINNKKR